MSPGLTVAAVKQRWRGENRTERRRVWGQTIFFLSAFVATLDRTLTFCTNLFLNRESKHGSLATNDLGARGADPAAASLHSRHRGGAADSGPLSRRALLDIRAVKSTILERNSLRIGEVFALL